MSNQTPENQDTDEHVEIVEQPQDKPEVVEQPDIVDVDPPKRRRGRPSNAEKLSRIGETLKTENPGKSTAQPKSRPNKRASYSASDIGVMAKQLVGVHQIAAMVTGIQEIVIAEPEAQLLAQSIVSVANEYDLAIDGKTGASLQLFMTVAMIYGPRYLQFRARSKAQTKNEIDGYQNDPAQN